MANSTEETQKSAAPAVVNSAEPATSVGTITTTTESAIAKNDERATASSLSASSPVPDALGTYAHRHANDTTTQNIEHTHKLVPSPHFFSAVYKYNRYVDRIFDRISVILKKSYDPVNVRLSTSITQKQTAKKPGQKKQRR